MHTVFLFSLLLASFGAGPTVSAPSVSDAAVGSATNITVTASGTVSDVVLCSLYVNAVIVGPMTEGTSTWSFSYTPSAEGSASAFAVCLDGAGNSTTSATTVFTVSGSLIKLACDGSEDVHDPCRAVYYYGTDGSRHAFPNEKVYFTWYADFDDVIVVTETFMASLTLGANVTYHPGTRMVKFITVNTVYGVGTEGELRGITSEEVAESIWGSTWNQQIDDISDAFYGNYDFGEDIASTSDFDPEAVAASVDSIDDIL